ncbi:LOW QUALITY PROTEIN: hypothetical protein V1478_005353, partial [Vespula squamosa]
IGEKNRKKERTKRNKTKQKEKQKGMEVLLSLEWTTLKGTRQIENKSAFRESFLMRLQGNIRIELPLVDNAESDGKDGGGNAWMNGARSALRTNEFYRRNETLIEKPSRIRIRIRRRRRRRRRETRIFDVIVITPCACTSFKQLVNRSYQIIIGNSPDTEENHILTKRFKRSSKRSYTDTYIPNKMEAVILQNNRSKVDRLNYDRNTLSFSMKTLRGKAKQYFFEVVGHKRRIFSCTGKKSAKKREERFASKDGFFGTKLLELVEDCGKGGGYGGGGGGGRGRGGGRGGGDGAVHRPRTHMVVYDVPTDDMIHMFPRDTYTSR